MVPKNGPQNFGTFENGTSSSAVNINQGLSFVIIIKCKIGKQLRLKRKN